jgi:hypothetical protein
MPNAVRYVIYQFWNCFVFVLKSTTYIDSFQIIKIMAFQQAWQVNRGYLLLHRAPDLFFGVFRSRVQVPVFAQLLISNNCFHAKNKSGYNYIKIILFIKSTKLQSTQYNSNQISKLCSIRDSSKSYSRIETAQNGPISQTIGRSSLQHDTH